MQEADEIEIAPVGLVNVYILRFLDIVLEPLDHVTSNALFDIF